MEIELEIAKLRRLRCRADYPLRLFLAAMGRLHWLEERGEHGVGRARGAGAPRSVPTMLWRSEERGCPYCGRNAVGWRGRRAGAR